MIDEGEYAKAVGETLLADLSGNSNSVTRICDCMRCERLLYDFKAEDRFAGYSRINPLTHGELTDHQSFLASKEVNAFVFSTRSWGE